MAEGPPRGYVDPNFPPPDPLGPSDAPIIIYGYIPSFALAVLAIVLFAISSGLHGFQVFRYRTWYFTTMVVGCLMEIVGYAARALSSLPPVFIAAAIYAVLSVLINAFGRQFSPVFSPRAILIIFITCDVIATGVQVAGAALIGRAESNREDSTTPNNILLGGLAFQVATFAIFCVLLAIFIWRARKVLGTVRNFIIALVLATIFIYLRTCFRLAETAQGVYGELSTNEVFFGCLEFAPVVLAVGLFNIWHPGRCIPPKGAPERSDV